MTVFGLVVLRIIWRLLAGAPDYAEPLGRLIYAGSRAGHLALYALMIAMPVSGYLTSTASGAPLPWFGLFNLPRLVGKDKSLAEATAWAHYIFAWTIAFVLAAHLGAVVLARGDQARHDTDAHVAEIPADRQNPAPLAFRNRSRNAPP